MNFEQVFASFKGQDIFDYLKGGVAAYYAPILQKIVRSNGVMGYHGVPHMPQSIHKAVHDELAPIKDEDELVQRYCAVGANMLYQQSKIGGQSAEEIDGDARAFEF